MRGGLGCWAPCPDWSDPVNTRLSRSGSNHLYSIDRRKEMCWLMHGWHLVYLRCCNGRDIVLTHLTALGIFLTFPHFLRLERRETYWMLGNLATSINLNIHRLDSLRVECQFNKNTESWECWSHPGRGIHLCWDSQDDNRIIEHSCQENVSNWWDIILNA